MHQISAQELIITSKQSHKEYLFNLFKHRELCYFFAWRDILVRYKQAFFGVAWALIRPILNMIVFAILFGRIAQLPSDNINYSIFVLAGMLPWQLFANATIDTCSSLVNHSALISKVYFPRMLIPAADIAVHLIDFAIASALLFVLSFFAGAFNPWTCLAMPLLLFLLLILCLGIGLWLSALTVNYRDFRILVTFFMQFGMFISPVGYGTFIVPKQWLWAYFLNPMVGIIDGFRWAFFGVAHDYFVTSLLYSTSITLFLFVTGYAYFRKMEPSFADKI